MHELVFSETHRLSKFLLQWCALSNSVHVLDMLLRLRSRDRFITGAFGMQQKVDAQLQRLLAQVDHDNGFGPTQSTMLLRRGRKRRELQMHNSWWRQRLE